MAASSKQLKLPASVLAQAKAVAPVTPKPRAARGGPAPAPKGQHALAREKVVAALKKLHPMD